MAADPTMPAPEGFLRNHERIAAVVLELLTGDPVAADRAVVGVIEAWREPSGRPTESRQWPVAFWQGLLRQPRLPAGRPVVMGALADLARIPVAARTAALLRLVGLGQGDVATAMGLSAPAVAALLEDALPRLGDGSVDAGSWHRWHAAVEARAHALAPQRVLRYAAARAGRPVAFPATASPGRQGLRTPLPLRRIGWVVVATALALGLTWLWPFHGDNLAKAPRIRTRALVDAPLPAAAPVAGQGGRITVDPADAAVIAQLPLYAWYANQRRADRPVEPPQDTVPETPQDDLETTDAP